MVILLGVIGMVGLLAAVIDDFKRRAPHSTNRNAPWLALAIAIAGFGAATYSFHDVTANSGQVNVMPWLAAVGVPKEQLSATLNGSISPVVGSVVWASAISGMVALIFRRRNSLLALCIVLLTAALAVSVRFSPELVREPLSDIPLTVIGVLGLITLFSVLFLRGDRSRIPTTFVCFAVAILVTASVASQATSFPIVVVIVAVLLAVGVTAANIATLLTRKTAQVGATPKSGAQRVFVGIPLLASALFPCWPRRYCSGCWRFGCKVPMRGPAQWPRSGLPAAPPSPCCWPTLFCASHSSS